MSPYTLGLPTRVVRVAPASRGTTSEPQAGQWNTPSGRRLISGWPHSQACSPNASGRATICSRVLGTAPSKVRPQESHSARSSPRVPSSSPRPHAGQTMEFGPDVTRDGTFTFLFTFLLLLSSSAGVGSLPRTQPDGRPPA